MCLMVLLMSADETDEALHDVANSPGWGSGLTRTSTLLGTLYIMLRVLLTSCDTLQTAARWLQLQWSQLGRRSGCECSTTDHLLLKHHVQEQMALRFWYCKTTDGALKPNDKGFMGSLCTHPHTHIRVCTVMLTSCYIVQCAVYHPMISELPPLIH